MQESSIFYRKTTVLNIFNKCDFILSHSTYFWVTPGRNMGWDGHLWLGDEKPRIEIPNYEFSTSILATFKTSPKIWTDWPILMDKSSLERARRELSNEPLLNKIGQTVQILETIYWPKFDHFYQKNQYFRAKIWTDWPISFDKGSFERA